MLLDVIFHGPVKSIEKRSAQCIEVRGLLSALANSSTAILLAVLQLYY